MTEQYPKSTETQYSDEYSSTAPRHSRPVRIAVAVFAVLIILCLIGMVPRLRQKQALKAEAAEAAMAPRVNVITVHLANGGSKLDQPGSVEAFAETPIYARTNGYVASRKVDIGDHVSKGQLLAVIEDPQTDQSLRQAQATLVQLKAALAQAQANAQISAVTYQRWKQLDTEGVVSQQDTDTRRAQADADAAAVEAAKANITAGEANIRNLQEQQGFERVTAPFSGIILSRSIDTGSLISSGSASGVTQMFSIGQSDVVRVFISIPQSDAVSLHQGDTAEVTFRELPGQVYKGSITRTSDSIDPTTRTLLVEVDLKNPDYKILPGMYADVSFNVQRATPPVMLPANALLLRSDGPEAVVVDADDTVHFHKLTLGYDYGTAVEVLAGLDANDTVVLNPSDEVREGVTVSPQSSK